MQVTADLAGWIARSDDPPTHRARRAAQQALLDWAGVCLAGAKDPLVDLLVADAAAQTGLGGGALVGRAERLHADAAALVMGSASHVLDFDDINKRMRGHPSVAILPALLTCGRLDGDLIDAFIAGTEVACCLGEMMGPRHYEAGFHTTATVGTVAAAAAVCSLTRADAEVTQRTLSLAATQASGLRAMFGSMAKPLHAGLAAQSGLRAARWASAGMTAPLDGLDSPQGFGPVLSGDFTPQSIRANTPKPFGIEENVFKYHAACYYTHSAIEAISTLKDEANIRPEDISSISVGLQAPLLTVCDIVEPTTGLETKFSVRHLIAMALLDYDTTNPEVFSDAVTHDPQIRHLGKKVTAVPFDTANRMEARVQVTLVDQQMHEMVCDVSAPSTDLDHQERALLKKFVRLARPRLGALAEQTATDLLAATSASDVFYALNPKGAPL